MSVVVIVIAILVMLIGVAGSVLPILPGLPVVWLAFLGYGLYDGWASYGLVSMIVVTLVVAGSLVLDQLASVWGAKRLGAGKAGMVGSVVGGILGLVFLSLPGLIIGAFGGAVACEMVFRERSFEESMSAGAGALLGLLCGSLFKFVIGVSLVLAFVWMAVIA